MGKPLTVDMATRNQTRPSLSKVKIEVDLMAKLPQGIRISEEDDTSGEIKYKWIKVQYDYMPKYCKECCLQGHDEHSCWNIHPELYEAGNAVENRKEEKDNSQKLMGTTGDQKRILTSGKIVRNKQYRQE